MSKSLSDRIIKSSMVVIVAHVLFKLMGLIQNIIIGHYFGNGSLTDSYVIAFDGIIFLFFLIGEESIGPALLPIFTDLKNNKSEKEAWQFTNMLLLVQGGILLLVVGLIMWKTEGVVTIINLMSGKNLFQNDYVQNAFIYFEPGMKTIFSLLRVMSEQSVSSIQNMYLKNHLFYMAPGLIGLSLGSTTYIALNGYKRFFWAAFSDTLTKICIIISILLFSGSNPMQAIGIGLAFGGFAKLGGHMWALRDKGRLIFTTKPDFKSPAIRKFMVLIAPLLLGIIFAKGRDFVNNILILNHVDSTGILTANSFGSKLFKAIGWFVPYGISIAMFPFFCDLIDKDDKKAMGAFMQDASRMLLLFFVPITAGGIVLSYPICKLLFEHGKIVDAGPIAVANSFYFLVLPFFSLEFFFMQGFFADRRTVTPTILGMICSSIAVILSYLFVIQFPVQDRYGPVAAIIAVALSFTISRMLKVVLLINSFRKTIPVFELKSMTFFLSKLVIVTMATGSAALLVRIGFEQMFNIESRIMQLTQILSATIMGGGAFLGSVYLLKFKEFSLAVEWTLGRLKRKRAHADS